MCVCMYIYIYICARVFVCVCVSVCVRVCFVCVCNPVNQGIVLDFSRGQWPTQESTANEATLELGGYPG